MATSKRLTVISTKPSVDPALYSFWGNQSETAKAQGWHPVESGDGYVRFGQPYNAPFNDVVIPNTNQKGRIQIIGKRGGRMDIVIADNDGAIRHVINKDVSPDFVQNYITNSQSTVQQRMNRVVNNSVAMK